MDGSFQGFSAKVRSNCSKEASMQSPEAMLNAARQSVETAAYNQMRTEEDLKNQQRKEWIVLGIVLAITNAGIIGLSFA
jgi:hypothetical protein